MFDSGCQLCGGYIDREDHITDRPVGDEYEVGILAGRVCDGCLDQAVRYLHDALVYMSEEYTRGISVEDFLDDMGVRWQVPDKQTPQS